MKKCLLVIFSFVFVIGIYDYVTAGEKSIIEKQDEIAGDVAKKDNVNQDDESNNASEQFQSSEGLIPPPPFEKGEPVKFKFKEGIGYAYQELYNKEICEPLKEILELPENHNFAKLRDFRLYVPEKYTSIKPLKWEQISYDEFSKMLSPKKFPLGTANRYSKFAKQIYYYKADLVVEHKKGVPELLVKYKGRKESEGISYKYQLAGVAYIGTDNPNQM